MNERYTEMLARLPEEAIPESEFRNRVKDLLTGTNATSRRQQYHRALLAMVKSGSIVRHDGMVRRQPSD
jgi:hypothetical protein